MCLRGAFQWNRLYISCKELMENLPLEMMQLGLH